MTLDQGEVRLAYAHDNVLAVAFHGPYRDIGMSFCDKEGNQLDELFSGYGDLNPGWTMAISYEMSDAYSVDQLALRVSDYEAPRNQDGAYANKLFTDWGEPMTDEELAEIGFDFLDGRCCVVSLGRGKDSARAYQHGLAVLLHQGRDAGGGGLISGGVLGVEGDLHQADASVIQRLGHLDALGGLHTPHDGNDLFLQNSLGNFLLRHNVLLFIM